MNKEKLIILDYLRGFFAFSVMIYHYCKWLGFEYKFLSFFGIYGVESFFILSGVVLTYNYKNNHFELKKYFFSRFFRILPLFYFLVFIEVLYKAIFFETDFYYYLKIFLGDILFLNMLRPDLTSVVAGWSIMNEMMFYLLFPLIILLKDKYVYTLTFLITFFVYIIFNYFIFSYGIDFMEQNIHYVSFPFNLPFFLIGVSIGLLKIKYKNIKLNINYLFFILFVILLFVIFYKLEDNSMFMIMDEYRIFSILLIGLLVFIATFTSSNHKNLFINILEFFSKISYSLYLTHFLTFYILNNIFSINSILLISIISILVSSLTYITIEKEFTKYVKKNINK